MSTLSFLLSHIVTPSELISLRFVLHGVRLNTSPYVRSLLNGVTFSTKGAYDALPSQLTDPNLAKIWESRVHSRVRLWLAVLPRQAKHSRKHAQENSHPLGLLLEVSGCDGGSHAPLLCLPCITQHLVGDRHRPIILSTRWPVQLHVAQWHASELVTLRLTSHSMENMGCEEC